MAVTVVLPAYQEEKNLPRVIVGLAAERVFRPGLRVVVVDDGSTDGTQAALRPWLGEGWVRTVRHESNLGLGAALLTGFRHVLEGAAAGDIVVTMDADGTHNPIAIWRLVRAVRKGADVAVASRFVPGAVVAGVPFCRRVLSIGASAVCRLFGRVRGVKDYSSGFRAYRAGFLRDLLEQYDFSSARGFEIQVALLLAAGRLGGEVVEVPILLSYGLKAGRSKLRVLRTVGGYLRWLAWGIRAAVAFGGLSGGGQGPCAGS